MGKLIGYFCHGAKSGLTSGRSIIGPIIGGALARPCMFYPAIFPPGSIWDRFPYLLPNLFSAFALCFGLIIGILFLEETHIDKKKQRDRGLEIGQMLTSRLQWRRTERTDAKKGEQQPLLESEEPLPGYRTSEASPELVSISGADPEESLDLAAPVVVRPPIDTSRKVSTRVFNRDVVLNIVSYGILAL